MQFTLAIVNLNNTLASKRETKTIKLLKFDTCHIPYEIVFALGLYTGLVCDSD
jgi:hypothetical protein